MTQKQSQKLYAQKVNANIEHVNISVSDPQRSADLFIALFGWRIRWEGPTMSDGHMIHVGNDSQYIALYTDNTIGAANPQHQKGEPLNHIAITVDDLEALETKVKAAGLEPFGHDDYEPGKRFYFFDWNHIEFEIVSYV